MNKLRFYRDEDQAPRAEGSDEESRLLAQLLESDIQDDAVTCRELLDEIRNAAESDGQISHTGNSYTLSLTRDAATVRNQSHESSREYTLDASRLAEALEKWLAFIS
ncbi:MAG: YacL family protein [Pseudomonadota bacterium]